MEETTNLFDSIQVIGERYSESGDPKDFVDLMNKSESFLIKKILEFMGSAKRSVNETAVEEIYMNVYMKIYNNSPKYYKRSRGQFTTFMGAIVKQSCVAWCKCAKNKRLVNKDLEELESNSRPDVVNSCGYMEKSVSTNDTMFLYTIDGVRKMSSETEMYTDVTECLYKCIECINNEMQRETFRCVFVENMKYKDVSTLLNVTTANVTNYINWGKKELRKLFAEKYPDLYEILKEERPDFFKELELSEERFRELRSKRALKSQRKKRGLL